MATYTYIPYAITEMYCVIFAMTIWFHLNDNIGTQHEIKQLRNMIYFFVLMLLTDIIWAFTEDGIMHLPRLLNASINAVTVMSIAVGCYFWFKFIEDRLHFNFSSRRTLDVFFALPVIVLCILDIISIFTGFIFYIDSNDHYQVTKYFYIHTIVNYFYLIVPTIYSFYKAFRARSRQDRNEYLTYAVYMIGPLISGQLESLLPHVPILALNIFMMILILFLMIQNMQVYHDALTGLNNRRRLNQYLADCIPKSNSEHPIIIFIMDINRFKTINDMYGHLEGDHALKVFAGALKETAFKYSAFVARYGGDEFCMVVHAIGDNSPEEIAEDIKNNVINEPINDEHEKEKKYQLTVSIGYAVCNNAEMKPEAVIAAADVDMYNNKKKWHSEHAK